VQVVVVPIAAYRESVNMNQKFENSELVILILSVLYYK